MNYRHIFHAGNFADVFKHAILIQLLQYLHHKDKPFCYIDTHAGIGLYDLTSPLVKRSPEYMNGILKVLQSKHLIPELSRYVEFVTASQRGGGLKVYPGSPWFGKAFLRAQDKMILNEYHANDFNELRQNLGMSKAIHYHHRDAYEFLPALLPPVPRRGLVLIDPPYENKDEFANLLELLPKAHERFKEGIYAVWYPIVSDIHLKFVRAVKQLKLGEILVKELMIKHPSEQGLSGCGMIILNPPWKIEASFNAIQKYLHELLGE